MINPGNLLYSAVLSALDAGRVIMKYHGNHGKVEIKDDDSPLTRADREAQAMIFSSLDMYRLPMVGEESQPAPYSERRSWLYFWLIDPLDGTKEFIAGSGEFSVNIALVREDEPILGVIFAPAAGNLWFGASGMGAFAANVRTLEANFPQDISHLISLSDKLPLTSTADQVVITSRSHVNQETLDFIHSIEGEKKTLMMGSSIKFCLVAEGKADIYPRFGTTMEWDTAAGDAILRASGGICVDTQRSVPLVYNKADLKHSGFIAFRLSS